MLRDWKRYPCDLKTDFVIAKKLSMRITTPKAFANCSPGLLQPWGESIRKTTTLKAFARDALLANAFSVGTIAIHLIPGFSQLEPWAAIRQRLRRIYSTPSAYLLCGALEELSDALLILAFDDALSDDEREPAHGRRFKEAAQR